MIPQYEIASKDVLQGSLDWRMWGRLGWQETMRRYRRTVLGPFWTTFSLGIFIFTLGLVWAQLWKQDPKTYLPFLTSGMLAWGLIQSIITEGCQIFTGANSLITSFRFPYTTLAWAVVWRNIIVLAHNFLIFVLVALFAEIPVTWYSLLALPGIVLIAINGIWITLLLGTLCARFRDIHQLVTTLLQVAMFVTPIFWAPSQLGPRFSLFIDFNFLFHFVDILRAPLLGHAPEVWSYEFVLGATVVGWALTLSVFGRFRRRIPYWM